MESALGKLIRIENSKGLELCGIYFYDARNKITIAHIHGNYGNFYRNPFISIFSKIFLENGINFLSINNSGHDGLYEGFRHGVLEYAGGAISDFNESYHDIESIINYAEHLNQKIILQGHSLGCDKILNYLIKSNKIYDFILLSPVDSFCVQKEWIHPETIKEQVCRINQINDSMQFDWLPLQEYGAKSSYNHWTYHIPVTKKAFLSIVEGAAFTYLNLEQNVDFSIDGNCITYIGEKDELLTSTSNEMFDYLKTHIPKLTKIKGLMASHDIGSVANDVASQIVKWLSRLYAFDINTNTLE